MPFKSSQPEVKVPTDLTIWDWLFASRYSPLINGRRVAGYTNAITGQRIDYAQVKEYTTYVSTALVKKYGLKEGETVALFSPNTIWYPVALLGTLRAGTILCLSTHSVHTTHAIDNTRGHCIRGFTCLQC